MMMEYEVGCIADMISGQRTPNHRPVVYCVTTPRKQPPQTPLTPTESPLVRAKAPKIAFTPEYRGKRQFTGYNGNEFDSPKSEPRRRQSNLAKNFRAYSKNERDSYGDISNNVELKKKSKKLKKSRGESNSEDKDSGLTDSGSNDMNDEIQVENVKQKKKNKRKTEHNEVDENVEVVKKKRKNSQMEVVNIEECLVVSKKKRKDSQMEDDSEKKLKKKKKKSILENDNFEAVDVIDDANVGKKKNKKYKKNNDNAQTDDVLEKTIEKKKKKLQSKTESKDEEVDDKENVQQEQGNEEGLTDFQKAARRRVNLKLKRDLKFEPDELSKTIFIGNVPLSVVKSKFKKTFKNIFSKYGVIETIRVRNIPVDDIKTNPKVALIEKKFHSDRTTATVYIKFQEMFSVEKALAENNTLLEGNHIRVDSCDRNKTQGDSRKTLFLGNLPFSIEEETLRKMFEKCGVIKSIRIVRDRKTQIGKGFGFVNFEKADGVELALMMSEEDLKINGKAVRTHRYNLSAGGASSAPQRNDRNFQGNDTGKPGNRKYESSKYKMNPMNKKKDEFGNKIRKNKAVREEKRRHLNESRSNDAGMDEESKFKNNKSGNYAGLVAKKKKKTKPDKGIMKKKRISKILMHKKSE